MQWYIFSWGNYLKVRSNFPSFLCKSPYQTKHCMLYNTSTSYAMHLLSFASFYTKLKDIFLKKEPKKVHCTKICRFCPMTQLRKNGARSANFRATDFFIARSLPFLKNGLHIRIHLPTISVNLKCIILYDIAETKLCSNCRYAIRYVR